VFGENKMKRKRQISIFLRSSYVVFEKKKKRKVNSMGVSQWAKSPKKQSVRVFFFLTFWQHDTVFWVPN